MATTSAAVLNRFPAITRRASGQVGGVPTHVSSMFFSDNIIVTISQDGRLAHWIQVPLSSGGDPSLPTSSELNIGVAVGPAVGSEADISGGSGGANDDETSLLPPTRLEPRTLLGGGRGEDRETSGHMYASHVAGQLVLRDPHDRRTLVVGLGLKRHLATREDGDGGNGGAAQSQEQQEWDASREAHFDMLELLQRVI